MKEKISAGGGEISYSLLAKKYYQFLPKKFRKRLINENTKRDREWDTLRRNLWFEEVDSKNGRFLKLLILGRFFKSSLQSHARKSNI